MIHSISHLNKTTLSVITLGLALQSINVQSMDVETPCNSFSCFPKEQVQYLCSYIEDRALLKVRLIEKSGIKIVDEALEIRSGDLRMPRDWIRFSDVSTWSEPKVYFLRKKAHEYFLLGMFSLQHHNESPSVYGGDAYIVNNLHNATKYGHAHAQFHLGVYLYGKGGAQNVESAKNCFRMAADRGIEEAKQNLAKILAQETKDQTLIENSQ